MKWIMNEVMYEILLIILLTWYLRQCVLQLGENLLVASHFCRMVESARLGRKTKAQSMLLNMFSSPWRCRRRQKIYLFFGAGVFRKHWMQCKHLKTGISEACRRLDSTKSSKYISESFITSSRPKRNIWRMHLCNSKGISFPDICAIQFLAIILLRAS